MLNDNEMKRKIKDGNKWGGILIFSKLNKGIDRHK